MLAGLIVGGGFGRGAWVLRRRGLGRAERRFRVVGVLLLLLARHGLRRGRGRRRRRRMWNQAGYRFVGIDGRGWGLRGEEGWWRLLSCCGAAGAGCCR